MSLERKMTPETELIECIAANIKDGITLSEQEKIYDQDDLQTALRFQNHLIKKAIYRKETGPLDLTSLGDSIKWMAKNLALGDRLDSEIYYDLLREAEILSPGIAFAIMKTLSDQLKDRISPVTKKSLNIPEGMQIMCATLALEKEIVVPPDSGERIIKAIATAIAHFQL
jgi:hypothetical protein